MFDKIVTTQRLPLESIVHERARVTCSQMLEDRGYTVTHTSNHLKAAIQQEQPVLMATHPGRALSFLVFFLDEAKIGVKTVRRLVPLLETQAHGILLVSEEGPTPFTKKELLTIEGVETMIFKRLVFNFARSKIVPPHRLLNADEEARLRERYVTTGSEEWPKLTSSDPVVRYYNWPVGGVVEIERYIGHEPSLYYRVIA